MMDVGVLVTSGEGDTTIWLVGEAEGLGTDVIDGATDGTDVIDGATVNATDGTVDITGDDGTVEIATDGAMLIDGTTLIDGTILMEGDIEIFGITDSCGDTGGQGFPEGFGTPLGDNDGVGVGVIVPPPSDVIRRFRSCRIKSNNCCIRLLMAPFPPLFP